MSTIEEFENAPVGATATSRDGRKMYRREVRTSGGADWVHEEGDAALWAYGADLAHHRYTLGPAPSPAPTTAREALDLAWRLAHPLNEEQTIPKGTEYLVRYEGEGLANRYRASEDISPRNATQASWLRTLDPLPDPEPDWLNAPAVLAAMNECSWQKVWLPRSGGQWICTCCGAIKHWSKMADVTPLYPKEDKGGMYITGSGEIQFKDRNGQNVWEI